jgi:hypothetical protein
MSDNLGVAFENVEFTEFLRPAFTLGGGCKLKLHFTPRSLVYPQKGVPAMTTASNLGDGEKRVGLPHFATVALLWAGGLALPALTVSQSAGAGVYAVLMTMVALVMVNVMWAYRKDVTAKRLLVGIVVASLLAGIVVVLLLFTMQSIEAQVDALLVFSGFATIPYFLFPPLLLFQGSRLAYKYLKAQQPLHFSKMRRLRSQRSNGKSSRGLRLKREDSLKLKKQHDSQYYHVLNSSKAIGLAKPLQQGDRARMRHMGSGMEEEDDAFNTYVRIAKVHTGTLEGRYDYIKTDEHGKYLKAEEGGSGADAAKFLKTQFFLSIRARNLQRMPDEDNVLVMLRKSMITVIYPFEAGFYWFHTFVVIEKMALAIITVISFGSIDVQVGVLVGLVGVGFLTSAVFSPFLSPMEDAADMIQRFATLGIATIPYFLHQNSISERDSNIILFVVVSFVFGAFVWCAELRSLYQVVRSFYRAQQVLSAIKEVRRTPDHSKRKHSYTKLRMGAGARIMRLLQTQVNGTDMRSWQLIDKAYLAVLYPTVGTWMTKEQCDRMDTLKTQAQLPRKIQACKMLMRTEKGDNYKMALIRRACFSVRKVNCIDLHFLEDEGRRTLAAGVVVNEDLVLVCLVLVACCLVLGAWCLVFCDVIGVIARVIKVLCSGVTSVVWRSVFPKKTPNPHKQRGSVKVALQ